MTTGRRLASFASLSGVAQAEAALSVLSAVALVRLAGPAAAGSVFFAEALAGVWFLVCDPRVDDVALRFVPVYRSARLYGRLLRCDVLIGLAAAAIGCLLLAVCRALGWLGPHQALLVLLAMLAGGAGASAGLAGSGFALTGQLRRLAALRLGLALCAALASLGALLLRGPVGYLTASAVLGAAAAVVLNGAAFRAVLRALGPADTGADPPAREVIRFAAKSSAATTLAVASDNGILTLAGVLGGPALVTTLKVAAAPGRLYLSTVGPAGPVLYQHMAAAVMARDTRPLRREVLRASALLAVAGVVAVLAAAALCRPALRLVYGAPYERLAAVAVALLGAACVRGIVVWSKTLPTALGWPGARLAYVACDGLLLAGALVLAHRSAPAPGATAAAYAWGSLLVACLGAGAWLLALPVMVGRS